MAIWQFGKLAILSFSELVILAIGNFTIWQYAIWQYAIWQYAI
jgi:hypothetical protein